MTGAHRHRAGILDAVTPNPAAATRCLHGLALGDAFGETFFFRTGEEIGWRQGNRAMPKGPWPWTDDTAMALTLLRHLRDRGRVDQDELAMAFATAYRDDPYRNYGAAMHDVLAAIADGEPWAPVVGRQFGGQGSWGNGAAMRVAPLGAWFADDVDRVMVQATAAAAVTHAHPEAVAGAVAVALATALVVRGEPGASLPRAVLTLTPEGAVADGLEKVAAIPFTASAAEVAAEVGCGARISAPDTVPYAIWCAARHLDDLAEALWTTAGPGGDIDTTCAIVGGIVAARTGPGGVPAEWLDAREPLPAWVGEWD